jgi:hypothetical protein
MDNDFLKNLDSSQVRELVDSMYPLEYGKGNYVIREGESGMLLDVSRSLRFFSFISKLSSELTSLLQPYRSLFPDVTNVSIPALCWEIA